MAQIASGDLNQTNIIEEPVEPPPKKPCLFSYMEDTPMAQTEPAGDPIMHKVNKYINEPCIEQNISPLKYRADNESNYPSLAKLSSMVLGLPLLRQ